MINLRADLHVHTVLSPCADIEMIPPLIVQQAIEKGIHLIAITDHNATANIEAVQKAARGTELIILPGMELQTVEEVHLLCLFDLPEQAAAWQRVVERALPQVANNIDFFGEQFVVDETGDFVRREEQLLLTSTTLTIRQAWEGVTALGGLLIPAHVNRKAFGLLPVLGLVPEDTPLDIFEISRHLSPSQARSAFPQIAANAIIQDGDAHFLEDIVGPNQFLVDHPSVKEIRKAILHLEGRSHAIPD